MGAVHLKALQQIPSIEVAIVSRNEGKLAGDLSDCGGNFGTAAPSFDFSGVRKFRDLGAALADPEIDAVDLCLPTHLHEFAAVEALDAGKHVLLEKPMALDREGCRRLIGQARQHGRILMVAQVLRFFPAYRVLASALKSAGPIRAARFRRRCAMPAWGEWQSDSSKSGSAVLDLLIHDIDIALHLFGAPSAIEATGKVGGEIDLISSRLYYDAGFTVEIVGGWHPGKFPLTMKYRIIGEDATIDYDFNRFPPRRHTARGIEDLPLEPGDPYAAEIAYFAECVRNGSPPVECPAEDSARAVGLALAMIEARQRNGEKIPWKSE